MNTPAISTKASWIEKPLREAKFSPFQRIGDDWMIVAAGTAQDWNGMTASWGGLGVLWGWDVAFVFIRPTRYSYRFTERSAFLSLSFFDEDQRPALKYFGANSGRDVNKAAGAGLTPIKIDEAVISFAEAREVLVGRKIYAGNICPDNFVDQTIIGHYPNQDYHRLYVIAIEKRLIRV